VLCNSEIKFSAFLEHALKIGADRIATGHYAGVREFQGAWQLLKAEDGTKDQSYFLHRLNQQQLAMTLFPLAGCTSARCAGSPRRLPACMSR
jgi:tRNA-specific 2-thiouridylase